MTPLNEKRLLARKLLLLSLLLLASAVSISAQSAQWISRGQIPGNAVQGGYENGRPVHVCRGRHFGGTHPGKLVGDRCYIGYGGREVALDNYETLVGSGKWRKPDGGYAGALVAGNENGGPLYLCRGRHAGALIPGKVVQDRCNVGYYGDEKMLEKFELFYSSEGVNFPDRNWPSNDGNRPDWNSNRFPGNAVAGGRENGQTLYVCRGRHMGGMHPGKVVGDKCNIGYGGREVVLDRYEVLTGNGRWGPQRINFMGAFAGGSENGNPLYLCRGNFAGGVHPRKVVAGKCNIGYGGEEKILMQFEVFYDMMVKWVQR